MDDLRPITPIRRPLVDKRARVPASKSVANRETVLSAIAGPIRGGEIEIAGNESSQCASALLLVAPRLEGGLKVHILGALVSAPFVDLTIASLRQRGVKVAREGNVITVDRSKIRARDLRIPGDVTAATYPAAAAAVLGGSVTIEGVDGRVREGGQGDARFFELL